MVQQVHKYPYEGWCKVGTKFSNSFEHYSDSFLILLQLYLSKDN